MDLEFKTIMHFRELGGMRTEDGRSIKHGFFYRCGELAGASKEDQEKVNSLNIAYDFDLRGKQEALYRPDFEGNFRYVHIPANEGLQRSDKLFVNVRSFMDLFTGMNEGRYNYHMHHFALGYFNMPYNRNCISTVLNSLDEHRPILLHCYAGKDRTGVLCMIIAAALGCGYEQCKANYMFHNTLMEEERKEYMKELERRGSTKWGIRAFDMTNTAVESWFDCAWYSIFNSYRTIDEYLIEEIGISREQIDDWRSFYLE